MRELINETELRKSVEGLGVEQTCKNLKEALKKKEIKPEDFSLKGLFQTLVTDKTGKPGIGYEIIQRMERGQSVTEGEANAVSVGAFSNINGQIYYNAILEAYALADMPVGDLFGVIGSNITNVQEKFAGVSNIGDASLPLGEGDEIPAAGLKEDFVYSPQQRKFGLKLQITREALVNDRVGLVLERAKQVGLAVRIGREKEACDAVINPSGASDRAAYFWKSLTSPAAVYQTSATSSPFYVNTTSSAALVDHSDINEAYLTLAAIKDPFTNEPMVDQGRYTLLCTPENRFTAERIMFSLQYRGLGDSANFATLVSDAKTVVPFNLVVSKYLAARLTAASIPTSTWFFGDFERAFKWVRHMDIVVEEAAPNAGIAFDRDILMQFRCLRFETPAVFQPRVVTKCLA